ncbi:hypothetical protein STRIP9103_09207 [Streptomyces ipomoeae 91-03]|uniref:Uncharacterized protein n=1 Tax=Streptomyces ipomoeae 91-03 TaxID=698759 RepID=L1KPL6_9ACTN|nr:hypothetical protein STRIP9103_09207 [Streptomyces ipomoeae 91-03]
MLHELEDEDVRSGAYATPRAVHDARSVIEVVDEAVQGSVTDRIRQSLDDELAAILFAGSTGTAGGWPPKRAVRLKTSDVRGGCSC